MFYCMGGAAGGNPPEVWQVGTVLATQAYLSELVNEMGATLIVPFSYLRANGIVAHPELMTSYHNLLAAGSLVTLTPVPKPQPTTPYPAARPYQLRTT
jgi:hypothetical protein